LLLYSKRELIRDKTLFFSDTFYRETNFCHDQIPLSYLLVCEKITILYRLASFHLESLVTIPWGSVILVGSAIFVKSVFDLCIVNLKHQEVHQRSDGLGEGFEVIPPDMQKLPPTKSTILVSLSTSDGRPLLKGPDVHSIHSASEGDLQGVMGVSRTVRCIDIDKLNV
jgi:hypothetical protein